MKTDPFGIDSSVHVMKNTIMYTIATAGYVPFVLNLIASLRSIGLDQKLIVFTLDEKASKWLSTENVQCIKLDYQNVPEWSDFLGSGFARIVAAKYVIGETLLRNGQQILYVDSDVVFKQNPFYHLQQTQPSSELYMQHEFPNPNFNTGFFIARASSEVQQLFGFMANELLEGKVPEDQGYFNGQLKSRNISASKMDIDLFMTGNRIFDDAYDNSHALVLHFNFTRGKSNKIRMMQRYKAIYDQRLLEELE